MAYSRGTVRSSSLAKGVYNPRAFIPHAALLRQACAHCGKFLAAASRRSLGRISVPVWLTVLSDQLRIVALVGHYPTNKLIRRRPLQKRPKALVRGPYAVLAPVSRGCPPLLGRFLRVTHPSAAFHRPKPVSTRDLHALGTPPAFILSQDQTLQQRTASRGGLVVLITAGVRRPADPGQGRRPRDTRRLRAGQRRPCYRFC